MVLHIVAPFIVASAFCILLRVPWQLTLLLFLFVPLVADVALVVITIDRGHAVFSLGSLYAVIGMYPLALLSFGYWAPLLGSLAWYLVKIGSGSNLLARATLTSIAVLLGALVGLVTMLLVTRLSTGAIMMEWVFVGMIAGAVSGYLVAAFSTPHLDGASHA
jgi:hypothetical protein